MLDYAPDEGGVYGLFDGQELIYVGRTSDAQGSIKVLLLRHHEGAHGPCTEKATSYTWEITMRSTIREAEILAAFQQLNGTEPRCQKIAA